MAQLAAHTQNGKLTGVRVQEITWKPNPEGGRPLMEPVGKPEIIKCEMALLAMGFLRPEQPKFADNVFVAGDAANGASLVVRAMASGKKIAADIDKLLFIGSANRRNQGQPYVDGAVAEEAAVPLSFLMALHPAVMQQI